MAVNNVKKLGADISFYVGETDFQQMSDAGAEFVFLRAGQGGWEDTMFKENQEKSRGIIPRGSYWFFDDRYSPASQAELYISILGDDFMELPLVVDYELDYNGDYAGWEKLSSMIIKLKEFAPDKKILIYTGNYYWKDHSPAEGTPQSEWFADYELWMAAYNDRPVEDQNVPYPWYEMLIWQFTGNGDGQKYGVSSLGIDLNWFVGTEEAWAEFIGGEWQPPEPASEPEPIYGTYIGEVITPYGVNIRVGAGSQYEKAGDAIPFESGVVGDKTLQVDKELWVSVVEVDGIERFGWMAIFWDGEFLIDGEILDGEEREIIDFETAEKDGWIEANLPANLSKATSLVINLDESDSVEFFPIVGGTPAPDPETDGRDDWKPDPNRPDNLYYTRDSGYKKVAVMSEKGSGLVLIEPQFSAIFLGDRVEGEWLHVIDQNGDRKDRNGNSLSGWIDYTANGMIELVEIPEEVLNSPIPSKTKEPEIFRYIEAPNDGEVYRQFVFDFHKEEHSESQPHTVNLYRDNPKDGVHGWLPLSKLWQFFLFDLMKLDAPGNDIIYYISAYCNLVSDNRCFTDLHFKDEKYTDYVLGQNLEKNDPYLWKLSIATRGNYIKQLFQDGVFVYVDGLDISKPPPRPEDVYDKSWLIHKANVAYPNEPENILSNGHVKTVYFPMIKQMINGKREKTGTSYPFFKFPHPVNRRDTGLEVFPPGEKRTIVNLSRWL